jgi:mxaC protein
MIPLGLEAASWLLLLPLALLPWLGHPERHIQHPALALLPDDAPSEWISLGLRMAASMVVVAVTLALAGLHLEEQVVTRFGQGAHLVFLLDRSSSMDADFAGRTPEGDRESKAATARRLLRPFLARRPHDLVGVVSFSTAAIPVLPLTDRRAAVEAALDVLDTPGLALSNVGRGLYRALEEFDVDGQVASRAIVLVSDGAATIGLRAQELIRRRFNERDVNLYWLFLHTAGGAGPLDEPESPRDDKPSAMPERFLHRFFLTLDVDYRLFDVANAEEVERALDTIGKLESHKLLVEERTPRVDLAPLCIALALAGLGVLAAARLCEVPAWST